MYKFIVLLILSPLLSVSLQAQEYTENIHAISINPIDFGRSEFQIAYELKHNHGKNSIVLMPSIILTENTNSASTGFQAMAQYRFYLTNLNKNERKTFLNVYNYGFYAGLYSLYLNFDEEFAVGIYDSATGQYENERFLRDIQSVEGGALLGIRIDITKRIIIDFYLGGGIRRSEVIDTYNEVEEYVTEYGVFDRGYTGVKPKSGLTIGITF